MTRCSRVTIAVWRAFFLCVGLLALVSADGDVQVVIDYIPGVLPLR